MRSHRGATAVILMLATAGFATVSSAQMNGMMGMHGVGVGTMSRGGGMMGQGSSTMMNNGMMGMGGFGMGGMAMGMMGGNNLVMYLSYADELGLSVDQVSKLKERQQTLNNEIIDLRAKMQAARIELQELLDQEVIDMSAVQKKIQENQALSAALMLSSIQANVDARSILTPEQRKAAQQIAMGGSMGNGQTIPGKDGTNPNNSGHSGHHSK